MPHLVKRCFCFIPLKKFKRRKMMKTTLKILSLVLVVAAIMATLLSCGAPAPEPKTLWDGATYKEDATIGTGEKTLTVTIEVEENSAKLTVKTDKDNLADALLKYGLVGGETSEMYGLTLYTVNGMYLDFNEVNAYWAIYVNGEYALTGASFIEIKDGDSIKIAYEKF